MASPSGIPALGDLQPGAHVGQFYWDQHDLLDTLVPFFAAGVRQHERCIWVCSQPLCAADARTALATVIPDLSERERGGQIEILDHHDWYARAGELTPDQVIHGWLDAEVKALAVGYSGLRVSGNTFWLEPGQWQAFAEYERLVHQAFRGRKIVALCSYSLAKCDSHKVVDVLHNHHVSLVRDRDRWNVVHGATAALAALEGAKPRSRVERLHAVEFYREHFPIGRVADRLLTAMQNGVGAAALVTREHGNALRAELARRGSDVAAAIGRGQLAILDADAVFEHAWLRPGLRTQALDEHVGLPLTAIIERYGACIAFGELVDRFARSGDRDGAVALERWWNQQLARHPIELACCYSLDGFADAGAVASFQHVCDEHRDVGIDRGATPNEADRLRAELAQVTHALAKELARRQVVDAAYASAGSAREHLVLLNRLTGALGEVTTRAQF